MQKLKGVKFILIDGAYCGTTVRGQGKEVLLLHGYKSSANSFYYQINALAENGFKAVAVDFPGFGNSAPISYAWSVGDYANWLKKFIAESGLRKPYILAHSFGARVAIKLLSEKKDAAQN